MGSLYKKGDWIRFLQKGKLILAVVEYTNNRDVSGDLYLITSHGYVNEDKVLEMRREQEVESE